MKSEVLVLLRRGGTAEEQVNVCYLGRRAWK